MVIQTDTYYLSGEMPPSAFAEFVKHVTRINNNDSPSAYLASHMKSTIDERTPLSRLLQFSLDTAGDQFIAEEFYHRFPDLLHFLSSAGCDNEEVLFRSFVLRHREVMYCRDPFCASPLYGGCPIVICSKCGKKHYLEVEELSELVCSRCVSRQIGECTSEECRKMHQIYMAKGEN
jgi:hypothetical protein